MPTITVASGVSMGIGSPGDRNIGGSFSIPAGARNIKWKMSCAYSWSGSGRQYARIEPVNGSWSFLYTTTGSWFDSEWRSDMGEANLSATGGQAKLHFGYIDVWALTFEVSYESAYAITVGTATGGTASANKVEANPGDTVTMSYSVAAGYSFAGWSSSPAVSFSGNSFVMPNGPITVTPVFTHNLYTITAQTNPAGAGSVSAAAAAYYGDRVSVSQTPNAGFRFTGWSLSSGSVSGGAFTMPNGSVTLTANYAKIPSTGASPTNVTAGEAFTVSISAKRAGVYWHRITLAKDQASIFVDAAAGATSARITAPIGWFTRYPSASAITGAVLTIDTYEGGSLIGTETITSGMTIQLPSNAVPTFSHSLGILRTVGGKTYADVGNVYVQGHCGLTAGISGSWSPYGATIASETISISGYAGAGYSATGTGGTTLRSGLLTNKGMTTITYKVTDSRGRSTTVTETINVLEYSPPRILNFDIWRTDQAGDEDPDGVYARYHFTTSIHAVGNNGILTRTIQVGAISGTARENAATNRNGGEWFRETSSPDQLSNLATFEVSISVSDKFESVTQTARLYSSKFLMHFAADGGSVAFGETAPNDKNVVVIGGGMTLMIGTQTLAEYIRSVMGQ